MPTDNDARDLLDTLLDRLDAMTPEQLAEARRRAALVDANFDPYAPVDEAELDRRIAEWRQREMDRLTNPPAPKE